MTAFKSDIDESGSHLTRAKYGADRQRRGQRMATRLQQGNELHGNSRHDHGRQGENGTQQPEQRRRNLRRARLRTQSFLRPLSVTVG